MQIDFLPRFIHRLSVSAAPAGHHARQVCLRFVHVWVHNNTDKNDFRESVIKVIKTFICLQLLIYEKNMHFKFFTVVCSTHVRLHSKPTPELIYMYITIPEELEPLPILVFVCR